MREKFTARTGPIHMSNLTDKIKALASRAAAFAKAEVKEFDQWSLHLALDLNPGTKEQLDALAARVGDKPGEYTKTLQTALELLDIALDAKEADTPLTLTTKDGSVETIDLAHLSPLPNGDPAPVAEPVHAAIGDPTPVVDAPPATETPASDAPAA